MYMKLGFLCFLRSLNELLQNTSFILVIIYFFRVSSSVRREIREGHVDKYPKTRVFFPAFVASEPQ